MGTNYNPDELYPLVCSVCFSGASASTLAVDVVTDGDELPTDDTGGWYIHLHDAAGVTDDGAVEDGEWYTFCPECRPARALPTADEAGDFDIDVFLGMLRDVAESSHD